MSDDSDSLVAANLTAAILGRLEIEDGNDGMREATRIYRSLLRRLKRVHEEEAKAELGASELPGSV